MSVKSRIGSLALAVGLAVLPLGAGATAAMSPAYVTCQTKTYSYTWTFSGSLYHQRMQAEGCFNALQGIAYGVGAPTLTYSDVSVSVKRADWYSESGGKVVARIESKWGNSLAYIYFEPRLRLSPSGTWQCFDGGTYYSDIGGIITYPSFTCILY